MSNRLDVRYRYCGDKLTIENDVGHEECEGDKLERWYENHLPSVFLFCMALVVIRLGVCMALIVVFSLDGRVVLRRRGICAANDVVREVNEDNLSSIAYQ